MALRNYGAQFLFVFVMISMVLAGFDTEPEVAAVKLRDALQSGEATAKFDAMIAMLGGPESFSDGWRRWIWMPCR